MDTQRYASTAAIMAASARVKSICLELNPRIPTPGFREAVINEIPFDTECRIGATGPDTDSLTCRSVVPTGAAEVIAPPMP